jgi:hypothetical protein
MSQDAEAYGEGITFYSTSSHGGMKVEASLAKLMPAALRIPGNWFEEDCDASLVVVAFPDRFPPDQVALAMRDLKNLYPDRYTEWTGQALDPAESFTLRERAFVASTAKDFVARAAWGSWHDDVPTGSVGVIAWRLSTNEEAGFLVPEDAYQRHGEFGCVVDESSAQPWTPPGQTENRWTRDVPEVLEPLSKAALIPTRRVQYGDTVYVLTRPQDRSWIVNRESDGRVFKMGPKQLKHCKLPAESAIQEASTA